jgi:hypothetical protein
MHTTLYDYICYRSLAPVILVFSYILISTNMKQSLDSTLSLVTGPIFSLLRLPHFVLVYLVHKDLSVAVCDKSLWKQLSWIFIGRVCLISSLER